MAKKKYDLVVKVGSYQSGGESKNRYINIGVMMEKDDGSTFILLERTFNPAGVPNPDNKENFIVSMFEPKGSDSKPTQKPKEKQEQNPLDQDVPF